MVDRPADPFALEPVPEVSLRKTPLFAVLFQARLPGASTSLSEALEAGRIQAALRDSYPYSEPQQTFQFIVQPGQNPVPQLSPNKAWQLYDAHRQWTVAIDAQSISLTTTNYESRTDFRARAESLLRVVAEVADPPEISRLGIRYLNRVSGEAKLESWLSQLGSPGRMYLGESNDPGRAVQAMSDIIYSWSDSSISMQARWGVLPTNAFIDAAMGPIDQPSWILDIDTFDTSTTEFDPADIADRLAEMAQRSYRFFKWVISEESLAVL